MTTPPDFTNVPLPFTPSSFWRDGEYDPASLVAVLKAQPGLADFTDDAGPQSSVRLDADVDPSNVGWWVTIPTGVAEAEIDAAIAAYTPPPDPSTLVATGDDHAAVSASIITEKLAAIPMTRAELESALQTLLGEAAGGIPFFEEYAKDPSMTAAQWTAFQQLPLTTTDGSISIYRLLYDAIRTLALLLRYETGELPTA